MCISTGFNNPVIFSRHEVNLSKLAMGNFALNHVNYSFLHLDIVLILVGMITNISDRKDTKFISKAIL